MNRKWHERCLGILIFIAILCTVLSGMLVNMQPFEIYRRFTDADQPLVFSQEENYYWLSVNQIVVADRYVYAVYTHNDFVQAYDLNGNYVCTIAVRDWHRHKGALNAYAYEDMLYLDNARSSDVYEFKDNAFVRYYRCAEDHGADDFLNENRSLYQIAVDSQGWEYYIDGVGISRRNLEGQEEVFVEKSFGLYLAARLAVLLTWLPMLGVWLSYQIKYKRKEACHAK